MNMNRINYMERDLTYRLQGVKRITAVSLFHAERRFGQRVILTQVSYIALHAFIRYSFMRTYGIASSKYTTEIRGSIDSLASM